MKLVLTFIFLSVFSNAEAHDLSLGQIDCLVSNGVKISTESTSPLMVKTTWGFVSKSFKVRLSEGRADPALIMLDADDASYIMTVNLDLSKSTQETSGHLLTANSVFLGTVSCTIALSSRP